VIDAPCSFPQGDQAPAVVETPEAQTFWQWLWSVVSQPGVLEVLLAAAGVAIALFVWWRLAALVQNARAREALGDYLLGVEQALQGDLAGARKRLARVLEQDPENHYARLLYGKVLGDLGQAEQAHQQHLYLQRAFGIASGENDLMLAQSLLAAGLPAEAADIAERALQREPGRASGWDFVYRARLQCGDHEAAAKAGRKLLSLLRDGQAKTRLREDLARTFAQAGTGRWLRGDEQAARLLLRDAAGMHEGGRALPLLQARVDAGKQGVDATAQRLLAAPASHGGERALQVVDADAKSAGGGDDERLPMATFAGLLEPGRWSCHACGGPLERAVGTCPRCAARSPAVLREPRLVEGIESPTELMDRIDVNEAHVQRLVRAWIHGDERVRAELLALGHLGVEELLRAAWKRSGDERERAIEALRAMGPQIAPALFAASDSLTQQRLLPVGQNPAGIVGRIVQAFDRAALPHIETLFASARADHRKILIDYYLGLADLDAFQSVLERFPPMEILHRFNSAERPVLQRFLQAVPAGHFVATSLLVEPTFYRDDVLLTAVPGAEDPDVLVGVMLRRGPSRTLTKVLVEGVADRELAPVAERVLCELGDGVLEHVLAAFANPEANDKTRERLARVLVQGGAAAAAHIADGFGPEATQFDDQLRALLVAIGEGAVQPLVAAFEHSGWLEKVSVGLIRRHNNRRVQVVLALAAFDGKAGKVAKKALKGLLKRETDDNLRLHLQRALHGSEGDA